MTIHSLNKQDEVSKSVLETLETLQMITKTMGVIFLYFYSYV